MATKAAPLKPPPGHHSSIGKSKTARPTNKSSPSPKKPASPKSPKARPTPPKKVLGGHADPSAAGASATSVSSALSESEREAARARLLAPTSASFFNWRPKMDPTQAEEAAQAEAGGEKPEFKVQTGKRRSRAAKTSRPERTVSCARTAPLSLACKRLSTLRSTPCAASAVPRSDAPSLSSSAFRGCSQNREKLTTPRGTKTTYAIQAKQSWEGRTTSPTGRAHPNRDRRNDVRNADLHHSINFFATSRVMNKVAGTGDAVYEVHLLARPHLAPHPDCCPIGWHVASALRPALRID